MAVRDTGRLTDLLKYTLLFVLWPYVIDVILGASVCCVFNWSCCQTSGPSSSYSWRSSTMNACSPTSQSCRRTGVWHLISPKKHTQHILVAKWNCVWLLHLCVRREPREGEGQWQQLASWDRRHERETLWDAEPDVQNSPQVNHSGTLCCLSRVCDVAPLIHRRVEQLSVWSECFHSLLLPSSLPHRKLLAPVLL